MSWDVDTQVSQKMIDAIQDHLDFCARRSRGADTVLPERVVNYSKWVPSGFGTSDLTAIFTKKRHLEMVDLKYGSGVPVYAENNLQGVCYLLGSIQSMEAVIDPDGKFKFSTFAFSISQPRLDSYTTAYYTRKQLKKIGKSLRKASKAILSGERRYMPGSWCKFCAGKGQCRAMAEYVNQEQERHIQPAMFEQIKALPTLSARKKALSELANTLSTQQLADSFVAADIVKMFHDAAKVELNRRGQSGQPIPGMKWVRGRTTREWAVGEQAVEEFLRGEHNLRKKDCYKSSLITPSGAESFVGKKGIPDEMIKISEGLPALVFESDRRKAIDLKPGLDEAIEGF